MKDAPVLTFQVREGGSTLIPAEDADTTYFDSGNVEKVDLDEPTEVEKAQD